MDGIVLLCSWEAHYIFQSFLAAALTVHQNLPVRLVGCGWLLVVICGMSALWPCFGEIKGLGLREWGWGRYEKLSGFPALPCLLNFLFMCLVQSNLFCQLLPASSSSVWTHSSLLSRPYHPKQSEHLPHSLSIRGLVALWYLWGHQLPALPFFTSPVPISVSDTWQVLSKGLGCE